MEIPDNLLQDKNVFKQYFEKYFKDCFDSFSKPIPYKQLIEEQLKAKPIKEGPNPWYNKRNKITRGLVKFSIKSNYTASMNIKDRKIMKDDTRYNLMMKYLNNTLEYCKKNKLPVPNTEFVVFVADRFPYELEMNDIKYPMFCYATIKNKKYPLLPDNTFLEFSFKKRFGKGENWDTSKKTFKENIYKKPKSNKLFFRGKDTTNLRTGLRRIVYEEQDKKTMKIELLEGDVKYVPMYKFSHYKYLFDLPGRYEWSNRFPRLFLCNRLVVKLSNDINQYPNEKEYLAFTDLLMRPNVDYLNYFVTLNELSRRNETRLEDNKKILKKELDKINDKLKSLDEKEYKKITKSGNTRINQLTNEHLYLYLYYGIMANYNYFQKHKNQTGGRIKISRFKGLLNNGQKKMINTGKKRRNEISKNTINKMYQYYWKNRDTSERIFFTSKKVFKDTKIAIIVPYRDNKEQERAQQLKKFIEHFKEFLKGFNYKIFIIEQAEHNIKFNRGKTLNIGIEKAIAQGFDVIISHDVDIYPRSDMLPYYSCIPKYPNHIGNVWKTKYTQWEFVGGILSMTPKQLKVVNGYPNNFWGWGGEDDALYNRITKKIGKVLKPESGTVNEWEHNNSPPNKTNIHKKENILVDLINWKKDGLNSSKYNTLEIVDYGEDKMKLKFNEETIEKIKDIYKDDYQFISGNNKLKKTVIDKRYYTLKSDKYKKIFFWNAKSGCTTLKKFVYETEENTKLPKGKNIHTVIGPLNNNKYYIEMNEKNLKKFKDYEKVLLFRDPVERLYSFYKDKILQKKRDNFIKKNKTNVISSNVSFNEFVNKLKKVPQNEYQHHLHLQTSGVNRKWIDKIIKLKDLNNYLKKMANYTVSNENITEGKTNITKYTVALNLYTKISLDILKEKAKNIYIVNGMRRSGNHLFLGYLISGLGKKVYFLNNIKTWSLDVKSFDYKNSESYLFNDEIHKNIQGIHNIFDDKDVTLIISLEDKKFNVMERFEKRLETKNNEITKIIVIRDILNNFASRIVKSNHNKLVDNQTVEYWKDLYSHMNDKDTIIFNYNKFILNKNNYRKKLNEELGLKKPIIAVSTAAQGSSFNPGSTEIQNTNKYLTRYKKVTNHKIIKKILNNKNYTNILNKNFEMKI